MLKNSSEELKLLYKKKKHLHSKRILATDASQQFQLDEELEDIKQQIKKLEYQECSPENNLEFVLWKLNHSKQVVQFVQLSRNVKTIKFRIQTSSKNRVALVWLLKSLVNSLNLDDIICADLPLDTYTYGSGKLQVILDGISKELNLGCQPGTHVEKITERIRDKMLEEQQHIFLLFYGVDSQRKPTLDKILKDFWLLLTAKVREAKINRYLLMCWINCKKKVNVQDIYEFSDNPQDSKFNNTDETLFDIPITTKFKKEDLKVWLKGQDALTTIAKLNEDLVNEEQINNIINQIWTKSQGKPELLLEEIYKSCNLCWEDYESRWQKFR